VVLTANATKQDKKICADVGSNDFLTKPIIRKTLYDVTARYLAKRADDNLANLSNDG
jgi:CheY-like chemotaxis protein